MYSIKKIRPLALSILLGCADAAAIAPPVLAKGPTAAAEQSSVLRATLDNGLRVVIVHDALAPMVTTQITYMAGSYEAPKGYPGTAHALEHMLFRDSKGLSGAQLNEMTGKMGAENNAFTTNDATQYYFVAPAQYVDLLLKEHSSEAAGFRHVAPGQAPVTDIPARGRERWVINKLRALNSWYTKGLDNGSHLRVAINAAESIAQLREIIAQFLTEAIALTGAGGIIGILFSILVTLLVGVLFPSLPSQVPVWAVVTGFVVSVAVGLFFGVWPAVKASKLDPVEALRYE